MTKSKGLLSVDKGISHLFNKNIQQVEKKREKKEKKNNRLTIDEALSVINRQMEVNGYRERTVNDYNYTVNHLIRVTSVTYLDEITTEILYDWLDSMDVSQVTKQNRIKYIKSLLNKCYDNGWIKDRFWTTIKIRVDKQIKKAATDNDVNLLLSLLDTGTFSGLRDYVAVNLMYHSGIRVNTLALLKGYHIDFNEKELLLDGKIMKNHKPLKLPLSYNMCEMIKVLIKQNERIRSYYNQHNSYIFITAKGLCIRHKHGTTNTITKQLYKYSTKYNLSNINPHALRRGFATNLIRKGANAALVAKSLGHSDMSTLQHYLDLSLDEVSNSLRDYLD